MLRIRLDYTFTETVARHLGNPLFSLLAAIRDSGSIRQAATALDLSYRHVWGELKRWEETLGHALILWEKGKRARLTPFGDKLLWAEERARARIRPQIENLAAELESAFAMVFDDSAHLLTLAASHDLLLPRLKDSLGEAGVHLDLRNHGSLDALEELAAGRALLAGFHVSDDHTAGSHAARTFKRLLTPGKHKLIGFAHRNQGLMVARGNPLHIGDLADLLKPGLRFINRQPASGTRIEFDQLLNAAGIAPHAVRGYANEESTHLAVAATVASGAADCGFGIEAAAVEYGLSFVPLGRETYYLVCLKETLEHPGVKRLIEILQSTRWLARMQDLPGYQPAEPGRIVSLTRALPWYHYRKPKIRSHA
jgi:putative molybdopterin biosynthesis protein